MNTNTFEGYLAIADISGYTSYMAVTELAHSQAVLGELLELIVDAFSPVLELVKLEGDAVFAHVPDDHVARGDSVLDLIEATYARFRGRVDGIVGRTTCTCEACRAIPMLDLKFILHHGEYIVQHVSGSSELVGSDVNLLHRLTKNHVTEETGWHAYALFSEQCLEKLGVEPEGMLEQVETYEHLGDVKTYSLNVRERFEEMKKTRRVFVKPEEADAVVTVEYPLPRQIVWEWFTDPSKRNQWDDGNSWSAVMRPSGRAGIGAKNHCAHGKDAVMVETIVDWQPFDYYTTEGEDAGGDSKFDGTSTMRFQPINEGEGTRLDMIIRLENRPNLFMRGMMKMFARMARKQLGKAEEVMVAEQKARRETLDAARAADVAASGASAA